MINRDRAYLYVGTARHEGWVNLDVQLSIEQAARRFSMGLTKTWPGEANPVRIYPGDLARVKIGEDLVATGYLDEVTRAHSGASTSLRVAGRSKTQDVIDCSCDGSSQAPLNFRKQTAKEIAEAVSEPYHVGVQCAVQGLPRIPLHVARVGDRAFDVIDKVARVARLLVTDTPSGDLLLARLGTQRGPEFRHPGNIVQASCTCNVAGRFSHYKVKAQTVGDDENFGRAAAGVEAQVQDLDYLYRYRLLVIRPEAGMTRDRAKERAHWEAVTRLGKSVRVNLVVRGWRDQDGHLYDVNRIAHVEDAEIGIDADLLIVGVRYILDGQGARTEIDLTLPAAYEPELPARAGKAQKGVGTFRNASGE